MKRRIGMGPAALAGVLRPAPGATAQDQYALVNGCYALQAQGGAVGKDGAGYRAGATPAEGFRMQATDLGKYLLYGRAKDFLAAGSGDAVAPAAQAGEPADWRVEPSGGGFR